MKTKVDNYDVAAKLNEVNARITGTLSMYFVVKKFGGAGYEIRSSAGVMTGDIGLTKEGVISALCAIDCVHEFYRNKQGATTPQPLKTLLAPEAVFNKEQVAASHAAFDAALADLLADEDED